MKDTSTDKKFIVAAYDVVKNKPRVKLMKLLKGYGEHVQKSVFECMLTDEQIERLKQHIKRLIDLDEDSVRLYVVPGVQRIALIGRGEVYREKQLTLI